MQLTITSQRKYDSFSKQSIHWVLTSPDNGATHILDQIKSARNGIKFDSQSFEMFGLQWQLQLYPNGSEACKAGEIDCFAVCLDPLPELHCIHFRTKFMICELPSSTPSASSHCKMKLNKGHPNALEFKHILAHSDVVELDKITISIELEFVKIETKHFGDITNLWIQNPRTAIKNAKINLYKNSLHQRLVLKEQVAPRVIHVYQPRTRVPTRRKRKRRFSSSQPISPVTSQTLQNETNMADLVLNKQPNTPSHANDAQKAKWRKWCLSVSNHLRDVRKRMKRIENKMKSWDNGNANVCDATPNIKEEFDEAQQRMKHWLQQTVCLPEYYDRFISNGLSNTNIVKLIGMKELAMIGIDKLGHRLHIMNQINILKQTDLHHNQSETTISPSESSVHSESEHEHHPPHKKQKLCCEN